MTTIPHIPLLLTEGEAQLPYSGHYENPGYQAELSDRVHGYDIGNTLASAEDRDEVVRKILGLDDEADIRQLLKENPTAISEAQEKGILEGRINVKTLDNVVEQLKTEQENGEDAILITDGTYKMARSFIYGAGLEPYTASLVTTEEVGTLGRKDPELFLEVYEELRRKGKTLDSYCDDSKKNVLSAVKASKVVEEKYGEGFDVYWLNQEQEIGDNEEGFKVIHSIKDKKGGQQNEP